MYNIIDSLCKENGISIAQFCRESGVPQSTITELKHGRTMSLSHKNIVKAAEYFNVSTDYLLGNDTKKEPAQTDEPDVLDGIDLAFYGGYRELNEEDKEVLRDMVRVMRERRKKKDAAAAEGKEKDVSDI